MAYARIKFKSGREIHMGFDESIGLFNFWIYRKHLTGNEKFKEVSIEGMDCNTRQEYFTNLSSALVPDELEELEAIGFGGLKIRAR